MAALGWLLNLDFAGSGAVVTAPDVPGAGYTLKMNQVHYLLPSDQIHYTLEPSEMGSVLDDDNES